jgi:cytochrome c oxidase cbb3-type subunit 1
MNDQPAYNYKVVRQFSIMSVAWGIVGMLVGVFIAAQLIWPELNLAPWLSYGRLRPLHTNAVVFAFWLFAAGSSAFTCFLQRPAAAINRGCPLEPQERPAGCPKCDTTGGSCN